MPTETHNSQIQPPTYEERLHDADRRIKAGDKNIKQRGGNIDSAGNDFRTAAEYLAFARIEACGLTRQDAFLWSRVKDKKFFDPGKQNPSLFECLAFLGEFNLVSEEELTQFHKTRMTGNKSSHANRINSRATIEEIKTAQKAVKALQAEACKQDPMQLRINATGTRTEVLSTLLRHSPQFANDLTERINKSEAWAKQNPEKVSEKDQEDLQKNIEALPLMEGLFSIYYKRMKAEFPDAADKTAQEAITVSAETQMDKFSKKVSSIEKINNSISRKEGYIDRNHTYPDFDKNAYKQLEALENSREQQKRELNDIVRSLQDQFYKFNEQVGVESTKELRRQTGLKVAQAGYSKYIFNTVAEEEERKARLTAQKADAARQKAQRGKQPAIQDDGSWKVPVLVFLVILGLFLIAATGVWGAFFLFLLFLLALPFTR